MDTIKDQVKLPLNVAFEVVMQGIRIRFGRSLVTATGVVLGIAFLMSILSGQVIKQGVSKEADLRTEVKRMMSFLTAEMGPPQGRTVGVIQTGPLNEPEQRLLLALAQQGAQKLNHAGGSTDPQGTWPRLGQVSAEVQLDQVAQEASAILVVGDGKLPEVHWKALLAGSNQALVASTRNLGTEEIAPGVPLVILARELKQEEIEQQQREKQQAAFRNLWMTIISLVVTFICISNSLLMSVTERFKEIGTMKCLGALSSFVRHLFLIESSLIGAVGAVVGALVGLLFAIAGYGVTFGFPLVFSSLHLGTILLYFVPCLVAGVLLSVIAALYPASFAARMVPGLALRTNI
jgi:hypothetical protein